jgi:hypothetical protein
MFVGLKIAPNAWALVAHENSFTIPNPPGMYAAENQKGRVLTWGAGNKPQLAKRRWRWYINTRGRRHNNSTIYFNFIPIITIL